MRSGSQFSRVSRPPARTASGGYHAAFLVGAIFAFAGAAIGGAFLVNKEAAGHEPQEAPGALATAEAD